MSNRYFTAFLTTLAIGLFGILASAQTGSSGAKTAKPSASPKPATQAAVADTAAKINWMQFDLGLAKAKKENKHMFVDFTTSWCGWCKKMDAETFSRPEVIKYVNDHFIAAKVIGDSDKELDIEGYKISEKNLTTGSFKVTGFPAFAFLTPEGINLGLIPGYRQTDAMMSYFEFVKEKKYDTTKTAAPDSKNSTEKK
jgi:thioredoxin-related protein